MGPRSKRAVPLRSSRFPSSFLYKRRIGRPIEKYEIMNVHLAAAVHPESLVPGETGHNIVVRLPR